MVDSDIVWGVVYRIAEEKEEEVRLYLGERSHHIVISSHIKLELEADHDQQNIENRSVAHLVV